MKTKRRKLKVKIPVIVGAIFAIIMIAVLYIHQLNETVSNNVIQNISELAEHDQNSIQAHVETMWSELRYIEGKLTSYHCDTIEEVETQMNVECSNSVFSHIYMLGESGKVYTDKFLTYDPENEGQNGRIDLLPYFENENENIVGRFDDKIPVAGLTKEGILYGVRLENFQVEGIPMLALVGISDVSNIQDRLAINSFVKDGVSRGYSAVIDKDGSYIVNVEKNIYLNQKNNFFEGIDESLQSDLSSDEVSAKMQAGESFSFHCTNAKGVEKIVYCMPFEQDGIPWYFLSSVESTVFKEQNRSFLMMSMIMLAAIVIVIIVVVIFVMLSQSKVITANAEAKARSTFLANMSHEIRTPLNGIIGLIFLLEKDFNSGKPDKRIIKQRLSKAKSTAEYLLSLINNILDFSKLQAGKVAVNNEVLSLEVVIDAIWSMQKNNIEHRGIRFTIDKNLVEPWIMGDDLMIKQVLMNILSNAAKFTPSGGQIRLSVTQRKEDERHVTTEFVCMDTGCGMSEEFLEQIWDSFSQEKSNVESGRKGTGLGMAISKLLVDAMGGEISVKSKQGEGSTFYVTLHSQLPTEVHTVAKEMKEVSTQPIGKEKTIKILVAEDNELNAEILIEILKGEGFEVIHAPNGQVAVEQFRNSAIGEIQVILMDMQMPVMDGCSATMEIRQMDRLDAQEVSIFACTANNFNEDREEAEASGMNDFLSKPIDVNELLKKLEKECLYQESS